MVIQHNVDQGGCPKWDIRPKKYLQSKSLNISFAHNLFHIN